MAKRKTRQPEANLVTRARFMEVSFGVLSAALVGRLGYLQLVKGKSTLLEAENGRKHHIQQMAKRGSIYDRNGVALATNQVLGDVLFDCRRVPSKERDGARYKPRLADFETDIAYVGRVLNMTPADIHAIINQHIAEIAPKVAAREADLKRQQEQFPNRKPKPLPVNFSVAIAKDREWDTLDALRYSAEDVPDASSPTGKRKQKKILEGFAVAEKMRRVYTMNEEALHVVGRLLLPDPKDMQKKQEDSGEATTTTAKAPTREVGIYGLEQGYEADLQGEDGKSVAELDNSGNIFEKTQTILKAKRDGSDIHTTLDQEIQHVAMKEAKRIQQEFKPKSVSIVVLEPTTGHLLALVSTPTVDLSTPHPEMSAEEMLLSQQDRCATYRLEPGSVLKTLTIAAALELGRVTPTETFTCYGGLTVGNKTIHCDNNKDHGDVNITEILQHSCNIGAARIGQRLGGADLRMMLERFGICEHLNLKVTSPERMEYYQFGKFNKRSPKGSLTSSDLPRVSFGHSVVMTPIHLALAYGAIANGGALMEPRIVSKIRTADGKETIFPPKKVKDVIRPEVCTQVIGMLRKVVSEGTGRKTAFPFYQVAGKTGTARKYDKNGPARYTSSFIGFVPAGSDGKPRAVILVMVDEPTQGNLFHGGDVAGPAFREIAKKMMELWHVPKDDPNSTQYEMAQKPVKSKQVASRESADDDSAADKPRRHHKN